MRKDMMEDAKEMLEAAGLKDAKTTIWVIMLEKAIHEMVRARMGTRSKNHQFLMVIIRFGMHQTCLLPMVPADFHHVKPITNLYGADCSCSGFCSE